MDWSSLAPYSQYIAGIGAILLISAIVGAIGHMSRRGDKEKAEVAPPSVATTPEPQPSPSMYGKPILVLTPTPRWKRWHQAYFSVHDPSVKVVVQGEPGWEGFKLKPNDILVIYRKEVNDGPDSRNVLPEQGVPGVEGPLSGSVDS